MNKISVNKKFGFTLVELMIAIAIVGILAAVAGNAYYKYILKSKAADAPLLIKNVYQAESVFASQGKVSFRSPTYGDVECKPIPSFMPVCMQPLKADGSDIQVAPPGTTKLPLTYYANKGSVFRSYNHSNQTCTFNPTHGFPGYLNLASDVTTVRGNTYEYTILPMKSYFTLRAKTDVLLANEYNVPLNNTLMVTAIGDLNGNWDSEENIGCWQASGDISPSSMYFGLNTVSIYARGMYLDSEGDIQGTDMIKINELE